MYGASQTGLRNKVWPLVLHQVVLRCATSGACRVSTCFSEGYRNSSLFHKIVYLEKISWRTYWVLAVFGRICIPPQVCLLSAICVFSFSKFALKFALNCFLWPELQNLMLLASFFVFSLFVLHLESTVYGLGVVSAENASEESSTVSYTTGCGKCLECSKRPRFWMFAAKIRYTTLGFQMIYRC